MRPGNAGEQILARIKVLVDPLATIDQKASQQGREPNHVVIAVELAPASEFPGTAPGSAGFNDVCQDLVDRLDRPCATFPAEENARGESQVPTGQELLEIERELERTILSIDLQVSRFATAAHAALLHACIMAWLGNGKRVLGAITRARYNLLRA